MAGFVTELGMNTVAAASEVAGQVLRSADDETSRLLVSTTTLKTSNGARVLARGRAIPGHLSNIRSVAITRRAGPPVPLPVVERYYGLRRLRSWKA